LLIFCDLVSQNTAKKHRQKKWYTLRRNESGTLYAGIVGTVWIGIGGTVWVEYSPNSVKNPSSNTNARKVWKDLNVRMAPRTIANSQYSVAF
jgi:hypothetical protein